MGGRNELLVNVEMHKCFLGSACINMLRSLVSQKDFGPMVGPNRLLEVGCLYLWDTVCLYWSLGGPCK